METLVNNATIAAEMFDAFKRGDVKTLLDHMHPDIRWTIGGSAPISYARTYNGQADTATFFSALAKAVTFEEFVPEKILNADEHTVVSMGHFKGTVNATGKEFKSDWVMIDEFDDDGLVVRFRDYVDTQDVANAFL
jgi:ketosteroid isomerase-like protein